MDDTCAPDVGQPDALGGSPGHDSQRLSWAQDPVVDRLPLLTLPEPVPVPYDLHPKQDREGGGDPVLILVRGGVDGPAADQSPSSGGAEDGWSGRGRVERPRTGGAAGVKASMASAPWEERLALVNDRSASHQTFPNRRALCIDEIDGRTSAIVRLSVNGGERECAYSISGERVSEACFDGAGEPHPGRRWTVAARQVGGFERAWRPRSHLPRQVDVVRLLEAAFRKSIVQEGGD